MLEQGAQMPRLLPGLSACTRGASGAWGLPWAICPQIRSIRVGFQAIEGVDAALLGGIELGHHHLDVFQLLAQGSGASPR